MTWNKTADENKSSLKNKYKSLLQTKNTYKYICKISHTYTHASCCRKLYLTKVSNLDTTLVVQKEVFWLKVSVHNHMSMAVVYPWDDLLEELASFWLTQLKVESAWAITHQLQNRDKTPDTLQNPPYLLLAPTWKRRISHLVSKAYAG